MDENILLIKNAQRDNSDLLIRISIKIAYFHGRQNVKYEKQER